MGAHATMNCGDELLNLDCRLAQREICEFLRTQLRTLPRHRGYVVGISGGIDSALAAALCVEAVGRERVHAVLLPERESQPEGRLLADQLIRHLGIAADRFDISSTLDSMGVYAEREAVVRRLFPAFEPHWPYRLVLPGDLRHSSALSVYRLEVRPPGAKVESLRPDATSLRRLQALTNVKQRVRMTYLYREAEARESLVCGTTNRSELALGFFVRHGDGGVDVEPLAGLYKTQVRALARHLELPHEIVEQSASPDTWSAPVSDSEFYLRLGYQELDRFLARWERGAAAESIATELGQDLCFVERVCSEFERRRRATGRHRSPAQVPEGTL